MKLIVDSFAVEKGFGGGSKRCFNTLKLLPDLGFTIQLYVPLSILSYVVARLPRERDIKPRERFLNKTRIIWH